MSEKAPYRPATLKTVAQEAGFSFTTVSDVLAGRWAHRYNEETRRIITEAAKRLNYRPHGMARAMKSGRSNLIAVVHFGSTHEVSRQKRSALCKVLTRKGYDISVVDLNWHGGDYGRAIDRLLETRVEGVVISRMLAHFGKAEIDLLKRAHIPVVSLSGNEEWGIPVVHEDTQDAMRRMTLHLAGLRRRKMVFLTNQYEARTTLSRIRGFSDGIIEAGGRLHPEERESDLRQWLRAAGRGISGKVVRVSTDETDNLDEAAPAHRMMQQWIRSQQVPDAILCTNDQWARGIFAAAMEEGLTIPRDVAVTGYDNETFGSYAPYFLTTVAHPIQQEAEKTVELLETLIQGRTVQKGSISFPCELVIRRSCGEPTAPVAAAGQLFS